MKHAESRCVVEEKPERADKPEVETRYSLRTGHGSRLPHFQVRRFTLAEAAEALLAVASSDPSPRS